MAGPRFARLPKPLLRWIFWIAALVALVYLCNYLVDARLRMTKAPYCTWNTVPNSTKPSYSARFCYLLKNRAPLRLDGGTFLVQVHHGVDGLVVERTYLYPDLANVYWEINGLGYVGDNGSGGFIDIPPTLIDRLRAKLP